VTVTLSIVEGLVMADVAVEPYMPQGSSRRVR
jgi:hypothetical protein